MPAWSLSFYTSNCEPCPNSFFSVPSRPTPHTAWELEAVPCPPAQAKEERLLPHLAAGLNMFPLTEGCEKWPVYTPGWIPSSSSSPKGNEGAWSNSTPSHPTPAPAACKKRRSKSRVAKPKPLASVFGRKHSQGPQRENILKSYMGPVFCTWNSLWHRSGLYPETLVWGVEGSFIFVVVSSPPQSRQHITQYRHIDVFCVMWAPEKLVWILFSFFFLSPETTKDRTLSHSQPEKQPHTSEQTLRAPRHPTSKHCFLTTTNSLLCNLLYLNIISH